MNHPKILHINKILSVVILIVTFGLVYLYYGNTYRLSVKSQELGEEISKYIFNEKINAEVEVIHNEKGWSYVLFSESNYGDSFKGLARLKRGWNGRYTIMGANYGSGYPISRYYFANGDGTFAIYGMFPDDRAAYYEYTNTELTSMRYAEYSGVISNRVLIQICRNGEPDWMGLQVYDSMGENITKSYTSTQNKNAPEGGTATAELFLVDFFCWFMLIVGSLLAFVCWRRNSYGNHLRQSKKIKYIIIGLGLLGALIITIVSIYAITYSPRNKNERAIEAVVTSLLTCPDIELTQLMELCATKIGSGFIEEPKPAVLKLFDIKMKDMFGSYLTENTLNYIMMSALRYHTITEEKGYKMQVEDIEINQDNKDSRNYTFTIHLKYASHNIEKKLVVSGRAQCLEVGKITFLRFSDDFFKNELMNSN